MQVRLSFCQQATGQPHHRVEGAVLTRSSVTGLERVGGWVGECRTGSSFLLLHGGAFGAIIELILRLTPPG
jgi:hypothetical protein